MQLVVRGVRRPVQLDGPELSLGCSGQCGSQRGKGVSGACPPPGACENLVCALKLLAKQQTCGHSPVDTIFEGLQEEGRLKFTTLRRRFIKLNNNKAVKIGGLENNSEAIKVTRPNRENSFSRTQYSEKGWMS